LASVRKQVRSWLTPLGLTASLREDLVYAVSEAVDNAVERAQDAAGDCYTINVIFSTEIGNVCLTITDNIAREPVSSEPDWFDADLSGAIIRALVQSVHIRSDAHGARARLRHPIDRHPGSGYTSGLTADGREPG
jgi:anti-sigma regulatory factor (Ser/Thr protein kinase)